MNCRFCGKDCKNHNSWINHERMCPKNNNRNVKLLENLNVINNKKILCSFCGDSICTGAINRHENSCYLNPKNVKYCLVCDKPIKDYKKSKGTCSHKCSNVYFSNLRNKEERYRNHRTICFKKHKKECVVCGENRIVSVHHLNGDHSDNRVENLIPMCPTHHQYFHSKYRYLVGPFIKYYLDNYLNK